MVGELAMRTDPVEEEDRPLDALNKEISKLGWKEVMPWSKNTVLGSSWVFTF